MKAFDLEEAKEGRPVCTRAGREVEILKFDAKNPKYPIIASVFFDDIEVPRTFDVNGKMYGEVDTLNDLVMKTEKKEGWINIYGGQEGKRYVEAVFGTKEEAIKNGDGSRVTTLHIEWEE